ARLTAELQTRLERLGQPVFGQFAANLGLVLLRRGEWAAAQQLLEAGLRWAGESRTSTAAAAAAQRLGSGCLETDDLTEAERHLLWALERYRESGALLYQLDLLPRLCEREVRAGRLPEAERCLADAQLILTSPQDWGGLAGGVAFAEGLLRA